MTFKEFWPRYLEAHSLPGTRSLHYFASIVGAISVIEAIVSRQPLLLVGIGLGYAMAIGAHRFIELNRPMIRVNAFWGAVADLRMFWLAVTGGLRGEIDRLGARAASEAPGAPRRNHRPIYITPTIRFMLLGVAALGLAAGLLDLDDLFEVEIGLHFAMIQLGAPIAAFAVAFFLGLAAMAKSFSALARDEPGSMSAAEESLWRASIALLVFGGLALMMAEFAEHGYSGSAAAIAFGILTSLIAITPALLIGGAGNTPRTGRVAPSPGTGVVLAKGIGGVGSAVCLIGAVGILGWQIGRWLIAGWEPMSLRAALTWSGVPGVRFGESLAWVLDAPAAVAALLAAALFALIALRAGALERQRKATWLFKSYMDEARGSGPVRRMSDGSPTPL